MKQWLKSGRVFVVFSLLFFAACDPAKEFEAELKTIDSCMTRIDELERMYMEINFDSLQLMVDHIMHNEDMMKKYYKSDTVNRELGMYMNNCKGFRKTLKDLHGKQVGFQDEIFALRVQFKNMKTDLMNGAMTKEQAAEYLPAEMEAVQNLDIRLVEFFDLQKSQIPIYYEAVPVVDMYVSALAISDSNSVNLEP
ncbi:MAG: hypothetical protein JNJ99_14435 [Crocinitomicaceae bacterium]|nr:hypothetical protein [Crocinitomicaceae bacterium]